VEKQLEINMDRFFDLESVIASKNPKLLKLIPGFLLRYLKRITRQEELNAIVRTNKDLQGFDFVRAVLDGFGVRVRYQGLENLPPTGKVIVAANHPLGGLDGMALMLAAGQVRKDVVFVVNDLLMNIPNLKEFFIPTNKHGSNAGNVKMINETFASGRAMLYFPAGLCSRKQKGGICDLEWKKTFVTKARQHQRDIIPCFINGRNSEWFYNLARLRQMLHMKANIEMLYLIDEMFKQRNKEILITFGKPIPYTLIDQKNTDVAWAQKIKRHVYTLEGDIDSQFVSE